MNKATAKQAMPNQPLTREERRQTNLRREHPKIRIRWDQDERLQQLSAEQGISKDALAERAMEQLLTQPDINRPDPATTPETKAERELITSVLQMFRAPAHKLETNVIELALLIYETRS